MSRRPLVLLATLLALITSCRHIARLDDVRKMAYGVKPAVVRISAYATAQFRYPAAAINVVANEIARGHDGLSAPRDLPDGDGVTQTGSGGSGSGFIIHPAGYILTSGHVVAPTRDRVSLDRDLRRNGAIAALVKHFPVDELRSIYRTDGLERYIGEIAAAGRVEKTIVVNTIELSNGEALPFTTRVYSPDLSARGADVALLKVERNNLPVLHLGDSDTVRVGDSIWSVGYPAVASSSDEVIGGWLSRDSDLEATFTTGTITAIKRNVTNTPVLQSNVANYRGNSGGPAVNRDGDVVAISTWGHSEAEQIKFLVPINVAKDLLGRARVPVNVDGEFNRLYRSALDAAADGRWPVAQKELAAASAYFPKSPDLVLFGHDIDRAIKGLPVWTLHPVATTATATVAAAALVFGLFAGIRRNRIPRDLTNAKTVETIVSPDRENVAGSAQRVLGRFTILNGTRAGERLGLGGSGLRIGRERTICEIVLDNPKVSRLHAEVVSIDGKVLLIDRNSSNGTYVNDQKIDKRYLNDGDIIYFGGRNAVAVAFHA
jgi:serine protease Do